MLTEKRISHFSVKSWPLRATIPVKPGILLAYCSYFYTLIEVLLLFMARTVQVHLVLFNPLLLTAAMLLTWERSYRIQICWLHQGFLDQLNVCLSANPWLMVKRLSRTSLSRIKFWKPFHIHNACHIVIIIKLDRKYRIRKLLFFKLN